MVNYLCGQSSAILVFEYKKLHSSDHIYNSRLQYIHYPLYVFSL